MILTEDFFAPNSSYPDFEIAELVDSFTLEYIIYQKVDVQYQNDGFIFRKKGNLNYKRCFTGEISAKISGVVGDGNSDDYAKLQKLINELEDGQILNLENKRYLVSQPLVINKSIIIKGGGVFIDTNPIINTKTCILSKDCNALEVRASGTILKDFMISKVDGYKPNTNDVGLKIYPNNNNSIEKITIDNVSVNGFNTCVELTSIWDSQIKSLKIREGKFGIVIKGKSVNNEISNNTSIDLDSIFDDTRGIWFAGDVEKEGWRIIDSMIYGAKIGIYAEKTSHVSFLNSMIDFCKNIGIALLDGCYNWNITGNYIALTGGQDAYSIYSNNSVFSLDFVRGNKFIDNDLTVYNASSIYTLKGIYIAGSASLYDEVRGNSFQHFTYIDIEAAPNLKTAITNNKCLSNLDFNIIGNYITENNIGKTYYQKNTDRIFLGKMKITYSEVPPGNGNDDWKAGDIVLNVIPQVGLPLGWVKLNDNVTWKPFGILND